MMQFFISQWYLCWSDEHQNQLHYISQPAGMSSNYFSLLAPTSLAEPVSLEWWLFSVVSYPARRLWPPIWQFYTVTRHHHKLPADCTSISLHCDHMPLLVSLRICKCVLVLFVLRCWLLWFVEMLSIALNTWLCKSKPWSTSYAVCKWSPRNGSANLTAVLPLLFTQLP